MVVARPIIEAVPNARPPIRHSWSSMVVVGALLLLFTAAAPSLINRYQLGLQTAAGVLGSFLLLALIALAPGIPAFREWIGRKLPLRGKAGIVMCVWCVPYFVYCCGTHDLRWLALLRLLGAAIPLSALYSLWPVRDSRYFTWQDGAIALWLVTVLLSNELRGVWQIPVNLDFMGRLFLIGLAAWSWSFLRPVPQLGYDFSLSVRTVRVAAVNFGLFAAVAIPGGLALHFTAWNPQWRGFPNFLLNYAEIFLFIAVLEELFFRGFLQNLLRNNLKSMRNSQVLVSCLFGLFHILHPPFPNWRYVVLASVAGWFYGSAFVQTENLMAPSLVHAMVDTVWRTFFSKS